MSARTSAGMILLVSALAGACTMVVELAAVRLLSPWYGTSSGVWTNVIGTILFALALGYLGGARLSRGARPERALAIVLLACGACTAWLPGISAAVAGWFLPAGLALDEAYRLLGWGSLAAALVLFAPAAMLLGCVPPLAVEILQRQRGRSAGELGGWVLAASTLGSLIGTFTTTHVALPELGLTRTFMIAGSVLALLGVFVLVAWGRGSGGGSRAPAVLLVPLALALFASRAASPALAPEQRLLEVADSAYQIVRVVESGAGAEVVRQLQVNEGFDSFQSVWQPEPGLLAPSYYYNLFALPPWWSHARDRWRVLVIGLGGGTAWRVLEGSLPAGVRLESSGIEIDPVVVELGARWMDLPAADPAREVLAGWDGRAALRCMEGGFDQIVLDAYANQFEIPAHLSTREFFAEVNAQLAVGGWLVVNVGAFGLHDPLVAALGATIAEGFGRSVLAVQVPFSRNCVLFARREALPHEPDQREGSPWKVGEPRIDALLGRLQLAGSWRWIERGSALVLSDDHNVLEALQRQSIAGGPARWLGMR